MSHATLKSQVRSRGSRRTAWGNRAALSELHDLLALSRLKLKKSMKQIERSDQLNRILLTIPPDAESDYTPDRP